MCGLFGLFRSPGARHPEWASDAFVALGLLAEERGVDSAGVALFGTPDAVRSAGCTAHCDIVEPFAVTAPTMDADVTDGSCRTVRGIGRFSAVWRPDLLGDLDKAPMALGHTRWATQGSPDLLVNAGPLVVGPLVGTHNGDVETAGLRARFPLRPATGGTDSEVIYQALAAGHDPVDVLTALRGRAALAWADRSRPGRVHLARTALSPLSVAIDTEDNVYWASNPGWFRAVARHTPVRFTSATLIREGTYLTIEAGDLRSARFTPTARPLDLLLLDKVWAGFTEHDRERDLAQRRHRVEGPVPGEGPARVGGGCDGVAACGG